MADQFQSHSRSARLDQVLHDLLGRAPELQAASVVSFDGLPMASALPPGMDEDRVAAMSAALLSLGERAAENFGRGSLNQVYVEGENGTVFLVSAEDEAVLVAVGARGAKVGLLMFEVRRSAVSVADALRADDVAMAVQTELAPLFEQPVVATAPVPLEVVQPLAEPTAPAVIEAEPVAAAPALHVVDTGYDPLTALDPEWAVDEPVDPSYPEPVEPYAAPYEPLEPYAAPYAEELPPPPSPWGFPLSAVNPPEALRRETTGWTSYDQTGREQSGEPGSWS